MSHSNMHCQSCGMPMAGAKEGDFGTEKDGDKNREYCSYCYKDGEFTEPDATVDQMVEISAKGWAESDPNVSYEKALAESKKNIPTLKRWQ